MFVSTILVLGICVLVSWLLVPYVCAGLEMMILTASFLVNGLLFAFAICILLYFARTKGIRLFIVVLGIGTMAGSVAIPSESRHINVNATGSEGFIIYHSDKIYKSNGSLLWLKRGYEYGEMVFKAISPNGPVLVSLEKNINFTHDDNGELKKITVDAVVFDYDGNQLSRDEYYNCKYEGFLLDDEKIKYIKMRLRVDKNIYLRHQIN